MANITVRTDDVTKEEAEKLFRELGISMSAAINLFFKQSIKERALPFRPTAKTEKEKYEEYFNPHNMKILENSIRQAEIGETISITLEELQSFEEMTSTEVEEFAHKRKAEMRGAL